MQVSDAALHAGPGRTADERRHQRATRVLGVPFLTFNNNAREYGTRTLWDAARRVLLQPPLAHRRVRQAATRPTPSRPASTTGPRSPSTRSTSRPATSSRARRSRAVTSSGPITTSTSAPAAAARVPSRSVGRYNQLAMGNQIFTGGLADPNQWTKSLYMTDVGVNWYVDSDDQVGLRLAARRLRQPGGLRPRQEPADQRPLLGPDPALLLILGSDRRPEPSRTLNTRGVPAKFRWMGFTG